MFYSSDWGQKSKTRVSYWWSCISLFAHVFSVKTSTYSPTIHSSTYRHSPTYNLQLYILQLYILQRENWNKTKALVNVPKKETHHESDDLNRINSREFTCLFALLVTHKEKHQSRMPVNLKKTEFSPAGVQAGSSSRTFHSEATGTGSKVQSKKLYRLKRKLLH